MLGRISNNGIGFTAEQTALGRIPIWLDPAQAKNFSLEAGFTLQNPPDAPAIVPVGTPIKVDEAARTANICYRFEVYEDATDSATEIKIKKDSTKYGSLVKVGMVLMKQPSATDGTGAAYAVTAVDTTNADYDQITLGTTLGVALTAGDLLAEADSAGASGKTLKYVTNYVTYASAYVENDSLKYTVTASYGGRIYDRRIRKIDATEKALLPQIKFSELK